MFRMLVLSVPFAIAPLAATQLAEAMLTRSLLPGIATTMQGATDGQSVPVPPVAKQPVLTVEPPVKVAKMAVDPELALKLRF